MPVGVAFGLSYLVSRLYPPDRVGLNVWLWWALLAVFSLVVMAATERLARRFLPLVALLKLSLIFPDEAPSRFKSALRRGTTAQLAREVEQLRQTGELSEDTSHSEYLVWLMKSLADHDRLTRGHSERVRAYADLIAEEMGLPAEDRQKLHWAALLHDVGKLDVPSDVLNKDGLPDEHEWALIAEHPAASIPYLAPLRPWLGEWASVADEHHERWDGQGYPNGLAKTEISRG